MFALAVLLAAATAAPTLDIHVHQMNRPTTNEASLAFVDLRLEITNRGAEPVEIRRIDLGTPLAMLTKSELRELHRDPARAESLQSGFRLERQSLTQPKTIAPGATEQFRVVREMVLGTPFATRGQLRIDVTTADGVVSVTEPVRLRADRPIVVRYNWR